MADQLLIIHGYSDGATSFTALRDFFVSSGAYQPQNVYLLNYDSMDDEATFEDFADKLDEDCARLFEGERIDVACHSTGSLVARAWLRMHYQRQVGEGIASPTSPVEHLLMFAPANFGSDLARLGESFLGKFRCTFFNSHHQGRDFLESGRVVLQGLEPASPFQWSLSADDLHGDSYFNPALGEARVCYPFVFAAGKGYDGIEGRLIPARSKPGTDGTVRICGTSLGTRKCVVDFAEKVVAPAWVPERKFELVPFAIFDAFNHGSIIGVEASFNAGPHSAGALALDAIKVRGFGDYAAMGKRFLEAFHANHQGDNYQQFFFKVVDDVGLSILDFFVDFFVLQPSGEVNQALTTEFDEAFKSDFTTHSADKSCRVLLLNVTRLESYLGKLRQAGARLVFDITAKSPLAEVRYLPGHAVLFDGSAPAAQGDPSFLFPNTTTLVEIILNRIESDKILALLDHNLVAASPAPKAPVNAPANAPAELTGRATLLG